MTVALNHTIVFCTDQQQSAEFLTEMLGRPPAERFGPFLVVDMDNGVSLDFMSDDRPLKPQHYAFLISEDEFDQIYSRITERGLAHWADPHRSQPGTINHNDGGRGVYFAGPDDHLYEVITRPYGSGE